MALVVLLAVFAQDPVQRQLDEALLRFEQAVRAEEAYEVLAAQIAALGEAALVPIARRLADDLRDGMASAAAPVLLMALMGHPEALAPLREAFGDPETVATGRLELAEALSRLEDHRSWRDGLRAIAADPGAHPDARARAAELLLLDDELAGAPVPREPRAEVEEPRTSLVDEAERPPAPFRRGPGESGRKKDGTSEESFITMRSVIAGAAAGLLALLLALKRKG